MVAVRWVDCGVASRGPSSLERLHRHAPFQPHLARRGPAYRRRRLPVARWALLHPLRTTAIHGDVF
jgi:hypothetical protein